MEEGMDQSLPQPQDQIRLIMLYTLCQI